jgi:hypothetical protein
MPRLGEFIGALLSDAVQARVRADLEAVKIAEVYSAHELLKHLPVPRFRLPDITVDFPVLVSAIEGGKAGGAGRLFDQPKAAEIKTVVLKAVRESHVALPRNAPDGVSAAVVERAKHLFESGSQPLLSPAKVSGDLASIAMSAVKAMARNRDADEPKFMPLEKEMRASFQALLLTKLQQSPYLQVVVGSGEIKSHGHNDSVVRVRLTITEDAYEVINRDDGEGYYLTPE